MAIADQRHNRLGDVASGHDGVSHLGRLSCEVGGDVLALQSLSHSLGGCLLALGSTELGLHVGTFQGLGSSELASLGCLTSIVAGELAILESLLGEQCSILLLGFDAEGLAASLALRTPLLVCELGSLLHGDLLRLLHHSLLVGVMVLACVVESGIHELQNAVGTVESLAAPVVQLVLTNEAGTIALEAVGSDNILLAHLLALGSAGHCDHGLNRAFALTAHGDSQLAVANFPGGHLAKSFRIVLEGIVGPLLGSLQVAIGPSDGASIVSIGHTSVSEGSFDSCLGRQ